MKIFKQWIACLGALLVAAAPVPAQQNGGNDREMTVEESYLQRSVEDAVIREQSRSDNREMKQVALQYIDEAIEHGNKSEEVQSALDYLAMEGIVNQVRENGRLMNNFPDIRTKAATYLGRLGTAEAKETLLKMVLVDNEPMVITEAVKSLASTAVGLDDNTDTVAAIAWVVNRFDVLNPDNRLALSAIEAFEKFAASNGSIDSSAIRTLVKIATGPYIRPVRNRAMEALENIRKYDTSLRR